jgi:hypothetical protein
MKKKFNCVEMMHEGGRRVLEETRGMTRDEIVDYWKRETARLLPHRVQDAKKPSKKHPPRRAAQ